MMALHPEVSININQGRLTCVVDPALALSPDGFWLTLRLNTVLQIWQSREFCHIIENTPAYQHIPQKFQDDCQIVASQYTNQRDFLNVLQAWENLQINLPKYKYNKLYCFADSLAESVIPEDTEPDTIWQFEAFSHSLDTRLPSRTPLLSAYRDALALAATLSSAFIITYLPAGSTEPDICQQACAWGININTPDRDDTWLDVERSFIRNQLILAGLAKLRWSGLRLVVLQLFVPSILPLDNNLVRSNEYYESISDNLGDTANLSLDIDYWQGARGYWYLL